MNEDAFDDRRRSTEEDYFRKRDRELIETMRRRAERDTTRERLAQRVGVADEAFLERLETLGFSDEMVPLLHVAPLVQVAWADGRMSHDVSRWIVARARAEGVEEDSAADRRLGEWLRAKPADAWFDDVLGVIAAMLEQRPPSERERDIQILVERCNAVAAVSGGVLGLGRVSSAERRVVDYIRRALETQDPANG
jgi:hypothetical protein